MTDSSTGAARDQSNKLRVDLAALWHQGDLDNFYRQVYQPLRRKMVLRLTTRWRLPKQEAEDCFDAAVTKFQVAYKDAPSKVQDPYGVLCKAAINEAADVYKARRREQKAYEDFARDSVPDRGWRHSIEETQNGTWVSSRTSWDPERSTYVVGAILEEFDVSPSLSVEVFVTHLNNSHPPKNV
jgi:hypothetical protein